MQTSQKTEGITTRIKESVLAAPHITDEKERAWVQHYLGTARRLIGISSKDRDRIIRENKADIQYLTPDEALTVLDDLIYSDLFDNINIAGKLLILFPQIRSALSLEHMREWITTTHGWAECDSLCQSCFTGEEAVGRWEEWHKKIDDFSSDSHVQVRRASLVLQVKPVRQAADPKLRRLAYETIDRLCSERHVLITKAISWLLRSLSVQDKEEVLTYIETNKSLLPGIAYRETLKKILTGRKNDRPSA